MQHTKQSVAERLEVRRVAPVDVLQVVLSLQPGGTERLVIDIVKRLMPSVQFVICCLDEPGAWAQELTERGVRVLALGRRPGFHPWLGYQIASIATLYRVRVLHCHHYSPFVHGSLAACLKPHLRLVFTDHGRLSNGAPSRKRKLANQLFARLPGTVCAVSSDLKRHLVSEGFAASRVRVIPNGIDPGQCPTRADRNSARMLLDIAPERFVVATAARLDPVKDLGTLIQAFALFRSGRRDSLLVIVGDGPEREPLEAAARRAGVADAVSFVGQRSDVRRLLPAFDVYVNCSTSEGLSLTILEAMAAALPIVATGVGGTPEVVVQGETGVLVPPRNPQALATALRDFACAPERARCAGLAARRRLEERFTLDRMLAAYANVYRQAEAG